MTSRPTLYLMVAVVGLNTCGIANKTVELSNKIKDIESQLKTMQPVLQVENIRGSPEPEKFYVINNQRVYLEIDGKPVEQYCK